MTEIYYDAAVLTAADRAERDVVADHRVRLELGLLPRTTAPVVAQVSRGATQVGLHRVLRGCEVEGFDPEAAIAVGALLGSSGTADVVDAHLVLRAGKRGATVLTSDVGDLERLAASLDRGRVRIAAL